MQLSLRPANEKWRQRMIEARKTEGHPFENGSVRTNSRSGFRRAQWKTASCKVGANSVDAIDGNRPAERFHPSEALKLGNRRGDDRLRRVRRVYLEVDALPEGKEGILCPPSGMSTTRRCADAGQSFEIPDAGFEIADTDDDVVDPRRWCLS